MHNQAIDPTSTTLRPLAEYCDRLPSRLRGRSLNRATIWRWALHGVSGGWKLQTVEIGGGRYTCDAWVWAFIHRRPTEPQAAATGRRLSAEKYNAIAESLGSKMRRSVA